MQKKAYYIFNQTTERFERIYPSKRAKRWNAFKHIFEIIAITTIILFIGYSIIELPREKRLKAENQLLKEQLSSMEERLENAISLMDRFAERDNNFYRVIMHMEPITTSKRYAGMENALFAPLNDESSTDIVKRVLAKFDLLDRQLYVQSKSFEEIAEAVSSDKDRLEHIPSIQPISETSMTQMASGYGYRLDPIYGTAKHHDGMDFASPVGTPVYATANGVVKEAGWKSGYGNLVEISHGYNYVTRYAHLSSIKVKAGQQVKRGDLIGLVGSTGKSTGSHLHYEVRYKGVPQNPVNYYFADLTPEEYAFMVEQSENAGHVMD